jgi:cytochrome c biogenesis protein ResB
VNARELFGRAWHTLRSRRLAVSLIGFLAIYSIVGTVVPRGAPNDAAVHSWAAKYPLLETVVGPLGLHQAYASPLFLSFALVLAACTCACAVERTKRALRIAREMLDSSEGALEHLRTRPQASVDVAPDVDAQAALADVEAGLEGLGLRIRAGSGSAEAVSGAWGVFGSPLFHWSIVALMVVATAGQATRAGDRLG